MTFPSSFQGNTRHPRESVRKKRKQRNNWKSLQMQKRTIRGSEWCWKGTARKEFEIRCPLCPLNRPVAVVSLAHNALSADKQSLKTQTHHSQSVPVKGNLAYWCPFHSSQLKPVDFFLTPRTVNMQKSTRVFVMLKKVSKRLWWVCFHPGNVKQHAFCGQRHHSQTRIKPIPISQNFKTTERWHEWQKDPTLTHKMERFPNPVKGPIW